MFGATTAQGEAVALKVLRVSGAACGRRFSADSLLLQVNGEEQGAAFLTECRAQAHCASAHVLDTLTVGYWESLDPVLCLVMPAALCVSSKLQA